MITYLEKRPTRPKYTNDDLRQMIEAGDRNAEQVLKSRLKKYASAADMNRENMIHNRDHFC